MAPKMQQRKNLYSSPPQRSMKKLALPKKEIEETFLAEIPNKLRLPVGMWPQPDETTCGPTCLYSLYRYWGEEEALDEVIARAGRLELGGTFAVFLGCDALRKGYRATIYTYNLGVFDPTWFAGAGVVFVVCLCCLCVFFSVFCQQQATMGFLFFLFF